MPVSPEPTSEEPVTRTIRLEAQLAQPKLIDRIEIREIRMLANQKAGAHIHNGPVVGSIVEGSVEYQVEGESATTLQTGDVFFEPEDRTIVHFDAGPDGVTFIGYFPLSPNEIPEMQML